jgi:hypothetical protein
MMIEAIRSLETSVLTRASRRHITEDVILQPITMVIPSFDRDLLTGNGMTEEIFLHTLPLVAWKTRNSEMQLWKILITMLPQQERKKEVSSNGAHITRSTQTRDWTGND